MIPAIGLMVGAYIITRMLRLLARPAEQREPTIILWSAGITVLVTLWVMWYLWTAPQVPALR